MPMTLPPSLALFMRRPAMRMLQLVAGALLMTLGPAIGGPLPGPFGIVSFAAGLTLVLRNSAWARRRYAMFKRRHPRWGHWTDVALRRRPWRKPDDANAAGAHRRDAADLPVATGVRPHDPGAIRHPCLRRGARVDAPELVLGAPPQRVPPPEGRPPRGDRAASAAPVATRLAGAAELRPVRRV